MSEIIRWGVLSTANIARAAVIPAIHASEITEAAAVGSRSASRAKSFAEETGIGRWYGSYEELLADREVDAVYIALPNSLHREWSIRAAEAGKHVLCEKPLALNAAECAEMERAARANGVKLMEAFMYRFHPRTELVKRMIDAGAVGRTSAVEASFTFRLSRRENIRFSGELGGGALMDVGCYCVNVIRTMTGREPQMVSAYRLAGETGVDVRLAGVMLLPGGITAHFDCSLLDERRERCTVAGEEGYLEVEHAFLPGTADCEIREVRGRDGVKVHRVNGVDEYRLMVEHFSNALLQGTPLRYGPEEAAANMRVINALALSARRNGAPVSPADPEIETAIQGEARR
jgi:predicted dehydrogenase